MRGVVNLFIRQIKSDEFITGSTSPDRGPPCRKPRSARASEVIGQSRRHTDELSPCAQKRRARWLSNPWLEHTDTTRCERSEPILNPSASF
jgi:hypothetical protein